MSGEESTFCTDRGGLCAFGCVQASLYWKGRLHNVFRLGHLVGRAVSQDEKFVRLEGQLLLFHDAVLRNANAVQPRAERAQSAHHNSARESANNPRDERIGYQGRADAWNGEESGSEQQPHRPPQKAPGLPQYFMRPSELQCPYHEVVSMKIL